MTLIYDTEVEVTERQFNIAIKELSGVIAHRKNGSKFFIKLMIPKYRKISELILF